MKVLINFIFLIISGIGLLNAQTAFQLESGNLTIAGTSSLHDWESTAEDVQIKGEFFFNDQTLSDIQDLSVQIPVESIKSTKGKIMDNKTYKALLSEKYPNITYKLNKINSIKSTDEGLILQLNGRLNIAGVEKTIDLEVKGKTLTGGKLEFQASKALKMTDFKIDPPTALLGTLKTGDDITVSFKVILAAPRS